MTKYELDKILATLPIGYYAQRNIGITSSETEETSFYNPAEDAIVISLPIINTAMKNMPKGSLDENAVRAMLYHEVSHAILTANKPRLWSDILNVFEDERIETLLADYYLNVDFKRQVFAINNICSEADIPVPIDGWQYFYQVIRFRYGDKKDLETVNKLIEKYANLTSEKGNWYAYRADVEEFYERCLSKFSKKPTENHMATSWNKGHDVDTGSNIPTSNADDTNKGTPANDDVKNMVDESIAESAEDALEELLDKIKKTCGSGKLHIDHPFNSLCDYVDSNLTDAFRQIFNSFNSRQLNNGNAMNGYSGVFNPRALVRDDYKYFIRQNAKGSGNGFSKFNLNLFIDCSGSYCHNVRKTNTIIKSLETIEKENPMFSFTVTCMEVSEWQLPKEKRYIQAMGNNELDAKLFDIYRSVQRGDAVNYNIVLFDGFTYGAENFKAFNNNNVTVISDDSNEKEFNRYAKKAKKHFVHYGDGKSYADLLYDYILETLQTAFR